MLLNRHILEDEPNMDESTIFVSATKNNDDAWTIAIDALISLLHDKKVTNMNIEFMDSRANKPFYFPRHNADFAHAWPTIRNKVLAVLGTQKERASMTVLRRGHDEENSVLTITIETSRETSVEWKASTYDQIKDIVDPYEFFVDVAFVRSSRFIGAQSLFTDLSVDDFRGSSVNMGDSLAVKGDSQRGSTVGGYTTLQSNSGDRRQLALTNSHCVESDAMTDEEKLHGILPGPRAASFCFTSPSELERDRNIDNYGATLQSIRHAVASLQFKLDHGAAEPLHLDRLADRNADVAKYEKDLHQIKHADLDFGQLYASSGKRCFPNTTRVIDWALIAPIPRRQGTNKLPAQEKVKAYQSLPYHPAGHFLETAESSVLVGDTVVKKDVSGVSWGQFTGIEIDINSPKGRFAAVVAFENCCAFMHSGDSGCMLVNAFGDVVGLGFGDCTDDHTGYAMPIKDVFEDIEAVTSMRVVEPRLLA